MRYMIGFLSAALLLTLVGCQHSAPTAVADTPEHAGELTVMSFNIRNGKANDGQNSWRNRRALVADVIEEHDPDVLALQEAFRFQLDHLVKDLSNYAEVGEGRGGGTADEYSAILYRSDRFDLLDAGTFWLSETPGVVSKHWGHHHYRICTWAHLKDRSRGEGVYVFNTHFDHQSQRARVNSAKLIRQRIAERKTDDPVILTGDMNAGEDNPAIHILKGIAKEQGGKEQPLVDTFRVLHPDAKQVGTGNGGYKGRTDGAKIDYILVSPGLKTLAAQIDAAPREGRYPSDHYPVIATVRINPPSD